MLNWQSLIAVPERDLARIDIAELNLACAESLPHPEPIDRNRCLHTIDAWAERCHDFTTSAMKLSHSGRCDYPDSEPRFRIQAMITHLQRDLGVRYP